MQHLISSPSEPFSAMAGAARVHEIPAWRDNICWLLVCEASGEAAVVDGPEAAPVLDYVRAQGLRLSTILTTHTHPDHIGLHRELAKRGALEQLRVVGNAALVDQIPGLTNGEQVSEGSQLSLGALEGQAMLTEGHINGHISYLFGDLLFCGDTLFAGGCGFLADGPPAKMHASLARFAALDPRTRVCCAHEYTQDNLRFAWSVEPDNAALATRIRSVWARRARGESSLPSTIADELATNPFMRSQSASLRAALAKAMPGAPLNTPVQVFTATRQLKDRRDHRQIEDSALPL